MLVLEQEAVKVVTIVDVAAVTVWVEEVVAVFLTVVVVVVVAVT